MGDLMLVSANAMRIIYGFLLGLDSMIYWLVGLLYNIFILVCETQLFSATTFEAFSQRIYAILGVVMLFVVAFQLLSNIVDPDKTLSGEASTGKLVLNIITSLIMIALLPTLFKYLYQVQQLVLEENIIGKVILDPYVENSDLSENYIDNAGKKMIIDIYRGFINPINHQGNIEEGCKAVDLVFCESWEIITNKDDADNYAKLAILNNTSVQIEIDKNLVEYRWFISIASGIFIVIMLVNFCIDMGVRVAKLAYFQLIAPVPIALRIIPNQQKAFDNWRKGLVSTYLEVFLRLIIIYFGIFLLTNLPDAIDGIWNQINNASYDPIVKVFTTIVLTFGILIFMKQAPKLIADMFGMESADMKLGLGKKLGEAALIGGLTTKAIGGVKKFGGKTRGAISGGVGAGFESMLRGGRFSTGFHIGAHEGFKKGGAQFKEQKKEMYQKATGDYKHKSARDARIAEEYKKRFNQNMEYADQQNLEKAYKEAYKNVSYRRGEQVFTGREALIEKEAYRMAMDDYVAKTGKNPKSHPFSNDELETLAKEASKFRGAAAEQITNRELNFKAKTDEEIAQMSDEAKREYMEEANTYGRVNKVYKDIEQRKTGAEWKKKQKEVATSISEFMKDNGPSGSSSSSSSNDSSSSGSSSSDGK